MNLNDKVNGYQLQDALPEEVLEEIETDLNPFREAPTEKVDELENRMTSAVGLMEKVLS